MFNPRIYLDKLEDICDDNHVLRAENKQILSSQYVEIDTIPTIISVHDDMRHIRHDHPPGWPIFRRSEIINSPEKMLISELTSAYEGALLKDDRAFTVRADYGSVIIPSILGIPYTEQNDEMPWLQHLQNTREITELADSGMPNLRANLGGRVLETEQIFIDILTQYEKLSKIVHIGCPDTQGPFNLAASIIGSDVYLYVFDHQDLLHRVLALVTETCIEFTKMHKKNVGESADRTYIMGWCTEGGVRIVDDSAINLSGEMYRDFCQPYNIQLSEAFDGFMGHYCGRGEQLLEPMMSTPGIKAHNFGNPEFQNFNHVYEIGKEKNVGLLWDGCIPESVMDIGTGIINKVIVNSWHEAINKTEKLKGDRL